MKKEKYLSITIAILSTIAILIFGFTSISNKKSNIELDEFKVSNKIYKVEKNNELYVSCYEECEIEYNYKELKKTPVIYGDIKVGDNYKKVFKTFNIKKGYAIIDIEISNALEDGTTDIIKEVYKNEKLLNKKHLNAIITFAYENKNGEWKLIKGEKLEKILKEYNEGETDLKNILIYNIFLEGYNGENYKKNEIAGFSIEHR